MRKANLSLSINAVVILTLAIALLGFGLTFTKTVFQRSTEKVSIPDVELTATADDPIALANNDIPIPPAESISIPIRLYAREDYADAYPMISCSGNEIRGVPQQLRSGEQKSFKMLMDRSLIAPKSQDICLLSICNGPTGSTGCNVVEQLQLTVFIRNI